MSPAPPDRSLDLLAGRVFDIPEPQFADLVRSLEARRLKGDQRATADAVLSRLRPRECPWPGRRDGRGRVESNSHGISPVKSFHTG